MPVVRIVIASRAENSRSQLSGLLASAGFSVYRTCSSGAEVRRALHDYEDAVLVIAGSLEDTQVDDLAWDLPQHTLILFMARPQVLSQCESQKVFKLEAPCHSNAILGAMEMLAQLHQMQLPRRSQGQKEMVNRAKALLMQRDGFSEPEAHRHMQHYAMNHGIKMEEYARKILAQAGEGEKSV